MTNGIVPKIRQIYLYLNSHCNQKCLHCWIDPQYITERQEFWGKLDLVDLLRCIDKAKEFGLTRVKISGGEPFLYKHIIELIIGLRERNISVNIETNATLISEKEALILKENKVSLVAVSLDGIKPLTHNRLRGVKNAFQGAVRGIRILNKYSIPIQIISCLYKDNKEEIKKIIFLAKDLGASSLKIDVITCMGRGKNFKDRLLSIYEIVEFYNCLERRMRDFPITVIFSIPSAFKTLEDIRKNGYSRCSIHNMLGILSDGSVSICGIGSTIKELILGNIKTDSIKEIWTRHPLLKRIREDIPDRLEGVCSKCVMKRCCYGTCRAEAYQSYGSLTAPFSFCQKAYEQRLFPYSRLIF